MPAVAPVAGDGAAATGRRHDGVTDSLSAIASFVEQRLLLERLDAMVEQASTDGNVTRWRAFTEMRDVAEKTQTVTLNGVPWTLLAREHWTMKEAIADD